MYINPLNNGDISDYNSLKKQRDYGSIIKKFQSVKLQTKPTELQKYYQYMTYQQPILNELNYVAERMRTEDIKKKTDDYNFIEELRIKREKEMKETTKQKEEIGTETLFDKKSLKKNDDITPVISSDFEMENPKILSEEPNNIIKIDLFGSSDSIFSNENILSQPKSKGQKKKEAKRKQEEKRQEEKRQEDKNKYEEALKKYSISTSISDTINRPIEKTLPGPTKNEISKELFEKTTKNMVISDDLQKKDKKSKSAIEPKVDTEKYSNIPANKRKGAGRPKGSKNTPKRTLDLRK